MISPIRTASPANVTSIYQYRLARSPRAAMPETPVTPVRPAPAVYSEARASTPVNLSAGMFSSVYHADQAGRSRVLSSSGYSLSDSQPLGTGRPGTGLSGSVSSENVLSGSVLQGSVLPSAYPAEMAARMRTSYPEEEALPIPGSENLPGQKALELPGSDSPPGSEDPEAVGAEAAQNAAEEGRCQTCEERKYQDGSDDMSVSYQVPTKIDPDAAPAAVRGHEMEHVAHEQAKAQKEGRKVVSQTVTLHTDICPECGRVYVSGGTTRTVTKGESAPEEPAQDNPQEV